MARRPFPPAPPRLPRQGARLLIATLLLLVALAVPAVAADEAPEVSLAEVELTDSGFEPRTAELETGGVVVWRNATDGEAAIVDEDDAWDSGPLDPGETFSLTLDEPGDVAYRTEDGEHRGTVVVTGDAPAEAPEPADGETAPAEDEPTMPDTAGSAYVVFLSASSLMGALYSGGSVLLVAARRQERLTA